MISSVHILGDHSAPLKNPGYNAAQLPLTLQHHFYPYDKHKNHATKKTEKYKCEYYYIFGFIGRLLYVAFSVIIVSDVEIGDK